MNISIKALHIVVLIKSTDENVLKPSNSFGHVSFN